MNLRRDVFQAIADPTRRAILTLLTTQALTAGAIAGHFEASRQTISKHIHILAECDLLVSQAQGREIIYALNPSQLKALSDFVEPFRQLWENRYAQLDDLLEQLKSN